MAALQKFDSELGQCRETSPGQCQAAAPAHVLSISYAVEAHQTGCHCTTLPELMASMQSLTFVVSMSCVVQAFHTGCRCTTLPALIAKMLNLGQASKPAAGEQHGCGNLRPGKARNSATQGQQPKRRKSAAGEQHGCGNLRPGKARTSPISHQLISHRDDHAGTTTPPAHPEPPCNDAPSPSRAPQP